MCQNNKIVFIVGMPRSGTKLLRDLLNQHSNISILPNETHFIPFFSRNFESYGDITIKSNFNKIYDDLTSTSFYKRMNKRNIKIKKDEWFIKIKESSFKAVIDAFFQCYREVSGSDIVGDKTPSYITQIPLLNGLFPEAKFIHIYRDPRDYAMSINKAWGKNKVRAVQRWKSSINKARSDIHENKVNMYNLQYEELLRSPEGVLKEICQHIGVDFEKQMLTLNVPSENLGDTQHAVSVISNNYNKWKSGLTHNEIKNIENIAGTLMQKLGYHVETKALNKDVHPLLMKLYSLFDAYNNFIFSLNEEKGVVPTIVHLYRVRKYNGLYGKL